MRLAPIALVGLAAAAPPQDPTLAQTELYTSIAHGCRDVDLATWRHPTRAVLEGNHVPLRRLELCNAGRYPIYHVAFRYDPMSGATDDFFHPFFGAMYLANFRNGMAFVDEANREIVEMDARPTELSLAYETFSP